MTIRKLICVTGGVRCRSYKQVDIWSHVQVDCSASQPFSGPQQASGSFIHWHTWHRWLWDISGFSSHLLTFLVLSAMGLMITFVAVSARLTFKQRAVQNPLLVIIFFCFQSTPWAI